MSFCTSIHCMDGRIQKPIFDYLTRRFNVQFVDVITEPGPCKIVAEQAPENLIHSIDQRLFISLNKHGSKVIAISGHHDCAGNPVSKEEQIRQIRKSAEVLKTKYPEATIVKLWINQNWEVEELD